MGLPSIPATKSVVDLEGFKVECRSLSRAEVMKLQAAADPAEQELLAVSFGTDTPIEDVRSWFETVPAGSVVPLIQEILKISRLDEGAQFRS